ncbi:methylmalonyl Co-A mutase-associated GTPase MeaB [Marinitenerispora sediminis]|uniref:Methylmalonyl Co-A mutase-associated GTPase MeaB n=1 Tax=Marinitenerispora sediminis TaxID=1931232 RepID=A0A368T9C9_9ACTN|nr:methylmalonyl Co-A mutase-associated GTPase MeaB [Marinitenerispora sediminis]RCV53262.1 methylmalonyl Co-A mutase-associated GTPase MeaB [Marinitenerispora sediminis]RCV56143.1 methylmalonyl Co-A mutase-associated GTPase MeaB [Marinitenerispora sediminis]RCV60874.1 methylmalonyl Co-A mutase-associated GTPase MeaB [Marinitenerispora sediminis]
MDVSDLVARVVRGEPRAVARAISLVEDAAPQLRAVMAALAPHTGRARVVGLTGAPGVGKSTCTDALVAALRERDARVAVLAVDPSSPFTGGALLGDRVRMQRHASDTGVFIRSMASRGHLGGLSWATPHALRVLDAAGFDAILVETVGVGQAEVDIAAHADSTLVLVAPGMGDSVQAAKAGVLEIADVFVVNKADRDGARVAVRELRQTVAQTPREPQGWRPPVVSTVAVSGEGIGELVERLDAHERHLRGSGEWRRRRHARAREEVEAIVLHTLRERFGGLSGRADLDRLATEVAAGRLDPYGAADTLLAELAGA